MAENLLWGGGAGSQGVLVPCTEARQVDQMFSLRTPEASLKAPVL